MRQSARADGRIELENTCDVTESSILESQLRNLTVINKSRFSALRSETNDKYNFRISAKRFERLFARLEDYAVHGAINWI